MHVRLTDVLACPLCAANWPLILLADEVEGRRILSGTLGCPNCHAHFRVTGGFADFGDTDSRPDDDLIATEEDAIRIAALLGVTEGPALVLVVGAAAVNAPGVARLVPSLEVVAAWPGLVTQPESEGVTRIRVASVLPLRDATMRAVALTDPTSEGLLDEAARVVAPRGRVVVFNGAVSIAERLEAAGLQVLARDEHATVALRSAF